MTEFIDGVAEYKIMDKTLLLRAIKTKPARNKPGTVCNKNNLS